MFETDVLIIGGGVAGLNAALTAAEKGARVVVTDKAYIERSGNIAGGVDHFLAYLNTGPEWDTREAYLRFTGQISRGAADLEVVDAVYCQELPEALKRLPAVGVPLTNQQGEYFRTQSYGQPGPWWINFNGKKMKPKLGAAVRKAGCTVLDRVAVTDILTTEGVIAGAAGFHIRTGDFFVIKAKAVVIATGGTNRLYINPTGLRFNTWMCPVNTGDGLAMALRAGAALANLEYLRMTVVPKGLHAAGLNAFVGMGGKFINSLGEEFMYRYDPRGSKAPRFKLVEGVLGELKEGRAPVYLDARHLTREASKHLVETLGYDKDTFPDFLEQIGVDLTRDLLELNVSEGMQGGPSEVTGSGIKIDKSSSSTVPGLYAAGNACDQCRSLHMAVTSGIHAGRHAAAYALQQPESSLDKEMVTAIKQNIYKPLELKRGITWTEFEDVLQRVVTEGLGPARNAVGLKRLEDKLSRLAPYLSEVKAHNFHELSRVHEDRNMLQVAMAMTKAASFRTESRFGITHYRTDYPQTDDENWLGQVLISQRGETLHAAFYPLKYNL